MNSDISDKIRNAQGITFLTGSGISAESGIPTFRDAQFGLWSEFKAEELATQEAFNNNPQLVWDWYQWRRQLIADARPNAAHNAITKIQQQFNDVSIITQNVDGLHQFSGSDDVIEFHGNIRNNKCNVCSYVEVNIDNSASKIPHCPQCDSMLRPAVVWFGESIPQEASSRSIQAVKNADVFFSIGTSSQVHPAAGLAELARSHGATIIEINPNATPLTSKADYVLAESASIALQRILFKLF